MEIQEAITKCLDDLSLSKNTVRAYKNGLNQFIAFLLEKKITVNSPIESITISRRSRNRYN
jgi:site-specific recombinase XerD